MALIKNTRFRQSLLVTAGIVAAPALAATVIITTGKATSPTSATPSTAPPCRSITAQLCGKRGDGSATWARRTR